MADERLARHSRAAGIALVLVLLAVSAFAVWSSQVNRSVADRAIAATHLADDYDLVSSAVGAEESLERKYRLEPSPMVRDMFTVTAGKLASALDSVRRDGVPADGALVDRLIVEHAQYTASISRMFAAIDRGDVQAALLIDGAEIDPVFGSIDTQVGAAARVAQTSATTQLDHLRRSETIVGFLTPLIFVAGLALAALLGSVTRAHRRLLDSERARAVHASLHDSLTGLPNRALLAERLDASLTADGRNGTCTGLLLVDLDRFKDINDTFGHQYGDDLLVQLGPRLTTVVGASDTVARLGGDEFAVVLPGVTNLDDVRELAVKLGEVIEAPFQVRGVDLDVEASIGVVLSGVHGDLGATLLQRADVAMYVAKSRGAGVFVYDSVADGHSPTRLALLGDLRRALERGELKVYYQPEIDLTTGDLIGAEALVRWEHPVRGLVGPDEFIPLAEHTGLIGPLTRLVLDSAIGQLRRWRDAGNPLRVSVNLSARNLLDGDLAAQVACMLAAHEVDPGLLQLEVTETAIMSEPAKARRLLGELSALGVRLSIDDFGAGYTSLGQLTTLPVNELKIDRSFVTTMVVDAGHALIVNSIIELGHHLGLTVVAEGVETHDVLVALTLAGCDVAQGFYLCRPVPVDQLDRWRASGGVPTGM